jgi:hypothetical protein
MATYYFIGDGSEVLACEARIENAQARLRELQAETDDELSIYERDPSETATDASGATVWANPAERSVAEAEYDLPTLEEASK